MEAQIGKHLIGIHFLIDRDALLPMHVYRILSRIRKRLELVAVFRERAAGSERAERLRAQAYAIEYLFVRRRACLIKITELRFASAEGIHILHHEFPRADNPALGTQFVPEFRLELVDGARKVLVRRNVFAHERGEWLLVRRGKSEFAAAL